MMHFRDMPWAKELKPGHEKLPVYAGFNRSFTQKYVDKLPANEFEELRSSVIKSVEQDFADGKLANKNLKYVGKTSGMQDIYTGLMTAVRGAHKTEGVANLSTYCPMFNIGNHGCYLDGCYVSNLGKAAGGTNTYTNAMYAGEFLQFRDDVVELINEEIGGMRINGQGDLSMAQLPQVRDMFKHAAMRGLKLKMITKQDDTWEILYTLRNQKADPKAGITAKDAALIRSKAREIVLQPSIDPYWIPVKMDDLPGSGARAMGIPQTQAKVDAGQANVGALDRAVDIYKQMGVDAKVIDGQVYRKYGYSWDQIDALKEKFPGVNVQPRIVVSSPREIAEYALKMPDVLQTWMHAKLPKGMISDIDPDLASTALNFHRRAVIEQIGPGKWQIKAQSNTKRGSKAAGTLKTDPKTGREYYGEGVQTSEASKAFQQLDAYIHANYAPDEVDQIYKALDGQLTEDGSALCCAGGASVKECFDCISFCHNGRHVTGARLGQMAKEYENLLPMAPAKKKIKMFHGTPGDTGTGTIGEKQVFDDFNLKNVGQGEGGKNAADGVWLTGDNAEAVTYAKGGYVYNVEVEDSGLFKADWREKMAAEFDETGAEYLGYPAGTKGRDLSFTELEEIMNPDGSSMWDWMTDTIREAKKKNKKGVVFNNVVDAATPGHNIDPHQQAIIFDPKIIKKTGHTEAK
jgi:hypothetical protein